MPRIRTLKPEFWADEKLAPLDPLTRLTFLGLISLADDAGRLVDSVKALDGQLFPYTDDSCADALATLARLGRIIRYRSTSGQCLIQITNWAAHQKINRPNSHVLPAPPRKTVQDVDARPHGTVSEAAVNDHGGITDASVNDQGGDTEASLPLPTTNDLLPTTNDQRPTPPNPPKGGNSRSRQKVAGFSDWWATWPVKRGRKPAEKAFTQLSPVDRVQALPRLRVYLERRARAEAVAARDPTVFIPGLPNPATWLRQARWDDEFPVSTGGQGTVSPELARVAWERDIAPRMDAEAAADIRRARGWPEPRASPETSSDAS